MKLTAAKIKALKPSPKPQKHYDGGGLHLYVTSRSKRWRLDYRYNGKPHTLSIGAYPAVSLADARTARDAAKAQLAKGLDPVGEQHRQKRENVARGDSDLWRTVAKEWREKMEREGRAERTLKSQDWLLRLATERLGNRRIGTIKAPEVLEVLREVEVTGHHETAKRLRAIIGRVFRYGIATGRAERDVAADLKDALTSPKVEHMAAVFHPDEIGALMRAIRAYRGDHSTRFGLLMLAYTGLRPGEVRGLHWSDVDWDADRIVIPGERMKVKGRKHIVPLASQVRELLSEAHKLNGRGELVFAARSGRMLSANTFGKALALVGYGKGKHTAHGFRRTFSTTLNEAGWRWDWIEGQLAHVTRGVRSVYNAAEYLDDRRRMVSWYAHWLDCAAMGVPVDPPADRMTAA